MRQYEVVVLGDRVRKRFRRRFAGVAYRLGGIVLHRESLRQ